MVQLLLEYGADPNQPDCRGNTPLHTASDTASDTASGTASILRRVSIITLLLKAGADVSSLSKDGYSPLQLAESRLKLVQTFKVKGVEMSIVKQELNDIVNMLLTYLQKQKSSHEKLETLSSFYSRLSLSSTVDQVQDDVKDLLAKLDALNITS
ncbi:Ankyrin repeat domain-containing protein 54 [Dufourea novaeangliae]|uniref:Ankyrin repeat domain-containing protein 54 n=2 Tax=Dufourea novaeangliae TaxID=178035 RepID=A0A154NWY1_DUFNO|nr:Ankyrin repeat domain-containing protein 54 [Dufourea novaeangliae]